MSRYSCAHTKLCGGEKANCRCRHVTDKQAAKLIAAGLARWIGSYSLVLTTGVASLAAALSAAAKYIPNKALRNMVPAGTDCTPSSRRRILVPPANIPWWSDPWGQELPRECIRSCGRSVPDGCRVCDNCRK